MSFKCRQQANFEILEELTKFFTDNADQRFCQGLLNLGILNRVQRHMGGQTWDHFYVDEAHTESTVTLGRVVNMLQMYSDQRTESEKSDGN